MTGISADPYWWQAAPPQDFHIEQWPERADVVIIGGGYTGFGAAIPLARAGLDVVVLERDQIGSGASTRNGGITSGNLRLSFDDLAKRFGADKATAFYQEAKAARADLAQFIISEKIDCDLQQSGRLVGALRPESLDSMRRDAERLTKLLDIKTTVYDRASLPDYIDTSRYCGGMLRDDIGGIHPAKLLAGMCQIARQASVKIATQTKVIAVSQQNTSSPTPEFRIETSRGIIRAGHVISATNAYTDAGQPWLRRRLVPVISEMIATEELGENMVRSLMPGLNMYGEALQLGHYYRPSPDGKRILLGGRRMSLIRSRRAKGWSRDDVNLSPACRYSNHKITGSVLLPFHSTSCPNWRFMMGLFTHRAIAVRERFGRAGWVRKQRIWYLLILMKAPFKAFPFAQCHFIREIRGFCH